MSGQGLPGGARAPVHPLPDSQPLSNPFLRRSPSSISMDCDITGVSDRKMNQSRNEHRRDNRDDKRIRVAAAMTTTE